MENYKVNQVNLERNKISWFRVRIYINHKTNIRIYYQILRINSSKTK